MGKVLFLKNLTHTNIIEAPETGPELLSDATVTALANKGVTAQAGVSTTDDLPNLINSIELGTKVQTKTGSVRLTGSYGSATVNCGFVPDLVIIPVGSTVTTDFGTMEYNNVVDFAHRSTSHSLSGLAAVEYGDAIFENHTIMDTTSNGFEIQACFFVSLSDGSINFVTNTSVEYIAIKYT